MCTKVERFIMENGREICEMAMVCKHGKTARNMRDNGFKIKLMVKENSSKQMVIYLRVGIIHKCKGDWINDKANGFGTYTYFNGAKYEGYWEDDIQHGFGIEKCFNF